MQSTKTSAVIFIAAYVLASTSLCAEPEIELPLQDHLLEYPVGMTDISYPRVHWEITTRANDRPLSVNRSLLEAVTKQGWALALPVRSGDNLDYHTDDKSIRCNQPQYEEFIAAGAWAGKDIEAVVN